jgi:hypothetical protein
MTDTSDNTQRPSKEHPFQRRVVDWMMETFSMEVCRNTTERNHRFLEESLELVQSMGCTQAEAHMLVDYVFGRPVGDPEQEVGGAMVTLAALCAAADISMTELGNRELARCWQNIEKIRAKQAGKPKHSPLPGPTHPETRAFPALQEAYEKIAGLTKAIAEAQDLLECAQPAEHLEAATPDDWYAKREAWTKRNTLEQPPTAKAGAQHQHTDECWEPDSGCDMGRNEAYAVKVPNVFAHGLTLSAADVDDIAGTSQKAAERPSGVDFDADLARLTFLRARLEEARKYGLAVLISDALFLVSFIDKLWEEYISAVASAEAGDSATLHRMVSTWHTKWKTQIGHAGAAELTNLLFDMNPCRKGRRS